MTIQQSESGFEVKLPRAERILCICVTAFYCTLVASGIIIGSALSIATGSLVSPAAGWGFFVGIVNVLPAFLWIKVAKNTGWFGVKYSITHDGITKILPNGKTESGSWNDVVFATWNVNSLGFSDGTIIKIPFLFGKLRPEQLQMVQQYAGEESPLTVAHRNYEKRDYGWNRGLKPILMKIFLFVVVLSVVGLSFGVMGVGLPNDKAEIIIKISAIFSAIGLIGIMTLVVPFLIAMILRGAADQKRVIRIMREQT